MATSPITLDHCQAGVTHLLILPVATLTSPMDSHPLFTVVTVNLDDREGLAATASSLFGQSFRDFEWWVIDGASVDGSVAYLEGISDPRMSYRSDRDRGIYDAMNIGLDRATGRYIIFMNSGDRFADTEVLSDTAKFVQQNAVGIVYGDAIEVGEAPDSPKRALPHWMVWYSMFTHHQAMFYRRSDIGEDRYDLSYAIAADWAFTARLLKRGVTSRHFRRFICLFQRGGVSQSPSADLEAAQEVRRLHRDVLLTPAPLRTLIVEAKLLVTRSRRRWPDLYSKIRSRW